jgi:CelD/BcsL family acetyltransferase involved in cellulose biosynthesis
MSTKNAEPLIALMGNGVYTSRVISFSAISEEFIDQWRSLEDSTIEPNAFLSPDFVMPAIEYLRGDKDVLFVAAYRSLALSEDETIEQLCGLGIFTRSKGRKSFPLPHLEAFKSVHSYLSGLLVNKFEPEAIINEIFRSLRSIRPKVYGVYFADFQESGLLGEKLVSSNLPKFVSWFGNAREQRAYLLVEKSASATGWDTHISTKRRKNYKRAIKNIEELGELGWQLKINSDVKNEQSEIFLNLEHSSWKKERSTSLLSDKSHEDFFNKMTSGFKGRNRIFFTELTLGGNAIASTCNLIAGDKGFAFKIAYDASLKKYSPGIINEMEFLKNLANLNLPIVELDSGATESSFINSYWPNRKELVAGYFSLGLSGKFILTILKSIRTIRRLVRRN